MFNPKTLAVLALLTSVLSAAPITGQIGGSGATLMAPIAAGDTSVTFISNPFANTSLTTMAAFGGTGVMSILPLTISSASPLTVTWTGGLSFTAIAATPLVVGTGPGTYAMFFTGDYASAGFDTTPGTLSFTFQEPAVGLNYTFSHSGTTAPEPQASALTGLGLLALSLGMRWRRNRR